MDMHILVSKTNTNEVLGHMPIGHMLLPDAIDMARHMIEVMMQGEDYLEEELNPTDPDSSPLYRVQAQGAGIIEIYRVTVH